MITYIVCILVLAAAVPTTVWLKREGERRWAAHQRAAAIASATQAVVAMTAQFTQLRASVAAASASLARLNAEFRKAMDQ